VSYLLDAPSDQTTSKYLQCIWKMELKSQAPQHATERQEFGSRDSLVKKVQYNARPQIQKRYARCWKYRCNLVAIEVRKHGKDETLDKRSRSE
jgi:hypothetical protein